MQNDLVKRPLLMTTALAAVLVGALCGAAAGAFASPVPQQTAELKGVAALLIPKNYHPTHFATGPTVTTAGKSVIVVGEHDAKMLGDSGLDLASPGTPPGSDPSGSDGVGAGPGESAPPPSSEGDGKDAAGTPDSSRPPKAGEPPEAPKPPKAPKPTKSPKPTKPKKP
ncbi:MAG: hypothetical protein JWQ39_1554 [Glaciihabitans sp.]|nr:hypothetical protein [Glaciihabitans sp.]